MLEITHLNHATPTNTREIIIITVCRLLILNPRVLKLNQGNKFYPQAEQPAEPDMGVLAKPINLMISSLVFQIFLVIFKVS